MTENPPGARRGLLASLTKLAATLAGVAHTRLELLSTELEEEREYWLSLMVLALTSLFCLGVGVVLATVLLVAAYWDTHRLLVLGPLCGLFLLTATATWMSARRRAKTKPRLFAASLSELDKDRQLLDSSA
jgi:uncharacterized membrane protein YqjE